MPGDDSYIERETRFRERVVDALARLENDMHALIGNGQPGRIQHMEAKLRRHDRMIWIVVGGAAVAGWSARAVIAALFGVHLP